MKRQETPTILKFKKDTGCMLEVCIFSNGIVVETWLTNIPKTSVYPNKKTFEKAMEYRNNTHKYRKIPDELLEELNNNKHRGDEKK